MIDHARVHARYYTARPDTRRDVSYTGDRLELLRRVSADGDLYLQRICTLNDRWRAMLLPGPRAGLQPLRPMVTARSLMSLWRGLLVDGVERPELYGLTVQLRVTRFGELTLSFWTRLEADLTVRRRRW